MCVDPMSLNGRLFLQPCTADDNVSPYWCIEKTQSEKDANMAHGPLEVVSLDTVEISPGAGAKFKLKPGPSQDADAQGFNSAQKRKVRIPVLVNTKRLKVGDALVAWQDKNFFTGHAKKAVESKQIDLVHIAKKVLA